MNYVFAIFIFITGVFANDLMKGFEAINQGDFIQAQIHLQKACDNKNAKGCFGLGLMHYRGDGAAQDYAKATIYYKKACDSGEVLGCFNLAAMHDTGMGAKRDKARAKELFKLARDMDYEAGCEEYKLLTEKGY